MISESTVQKLVEEKIEGTDLFLVSISVKPGNKILILIDNINGLKVDECVMVSRHVEFSLDREAEDFELQVSSPGADSVFKVIQQYKKYLGKEVEVVSLEGETIKGKLLAASENEIELEPISNKKTGNKKGVTNNNIIIKQDQIKTTKATISFK